jgi:hypothetical protein
LFRIIQKQIIYILLVLFSVTTSVSAARKAFICKTSTGIKKDIIHIVNGKVTQDKETEQTSTANKSLVEVIASENIQGLEYTFNIAAAGLSIQDITSPNINIIKLDDKEIYAGDYVNATPKISIEAIDSESAISSWSIEIRDTISGAVVYNSSGTVAIAGGQTGTVEHQVPTNLADNNYKLIVQIYDGAGNFQTKETADFNVSSAFNILGLIAGPNPININNQNLNIEYNLSADADVELYIYSISGKEQWRETANQGFSGGATGFNRVNWDGRNRYGEQVSNGVYILYVKAKSGTETKVEKAKILVMK